MNCALVYLTGCAELHFQACWRVFEYSFPCTIMIHRLSTKIRNSSYACIRQRCNACREGSVWTSSLRLTNSISTNGQGTILLQEADNLFGFVVWMVKRKSLHVWSAEHHLNWSGALSLIHELSHITVHSVHYNSQRCVSTGPSFKHRRFLPRPPPEPWYYAGVQLFSVVFHSNRIASSNLSFICFVLSCVLCHVFFKLNRKIFLHSRLVRKDLNCYRWIPCRANSSFLSQKRRQNVVVRYIAALLRVNRNVTVCLFCSNN